MYLSPQILFLAVWLVPLLAPYLVTSDLIQPVSVDTYLLILITIVLFFFAGFVFKKTYRPSTLDLKYIVSRQLNFDHLVSLLQKMFKLWCVIYVIAIIYSGGGPIIWLLLSIPKTYADFGIPTVSGFSNLIRAFILSAITLIYFCQPEKMNRRLRLIAYVLIFSAFIFETGRGNGVVLLLHPIAYFFLFVRVGLRHMLLGGALLLVFLAFLGLIQAARLGDRSGIEYLFIYASNQGLGDIDIGILEALLIPTLMYMAIPLVNLDLNVNVAPNFNFDLFYSTQGFFPTVLRDLLFDTNKDYGLLINESHNVSSFLIPFVRDFGVLGAHLCAFICILVSAYVYARARQGNAYWILVWPSLFMSLILTFFSLFFTSLVVIIYPFVAKYVYDQIRK